MRNIGLSIPAFLAGLAAMMLIGLPGQTPTVPSTSTPAAAQTTPPTPLVWPVTIIDATAPAATVGRDAVMRTTVVVANANTSIQQIVLRVMLRSASGALVQTGAVDPATVSLPTGVTPIAIRVPSVGASRESYPLTGWLTIEPGDPALLVQGARPRASLALSAIGLTDAGSADWRLVSLSALAALAAVAIAAIVLLVRGSDVSGRMGQAAWSFTDGWSSALMLGAPLLTSLTAFAGLPDYPHSMSRKTYTLVSLLLAGLIGLAPSVYNLVRLPTVVENTDGTRTTQVQGLVVMFLIASILTLTGCLAQLGLIRLLLVDIGAAALISEPLATMLAVVFWLLQALIWIYGIVSIVTTVRHQEATARAESERISKGRGAAPGGVTRPEQPPPRLPDWSPL